jgi:hypothetical protein
MKEFGKLSSDQLDEILAFRRQMLGIGQQLPSLVRTKRLSRLLSRRSVEFQWSWAYELELSEMLALMLMTIGEAGIVMRAAQTADPQQSIIDDTKAYEPRPGRVRPARLVFAIALLMANFNSVRSLGLYSKSINRLIRDGCGGDDDAFVSAIRVDPTAIAAPSLAKRLAIATMAGEKKFLRRITKAAGEGPHKALLVFDQLRFATALLEDSGAFEVATRSQLYETLVNRLGLYEHKKGDPMKGLFRNVDLWRKASST